MIWIILGLIFFIGIMAYQDIMGELEKINEERRIMIERLKIHKRLEKLEGVVFNGKKR